MKGTTRPKNRISRVMSLRDFLLLFAGSATSLLGDQFALIAKPWLTFKMTGDPLIMDAQQLVAVVGPTVAGILIGG